MEKIEYTITKSTVESYKVRCKSFYWADITIDANENKGRIQIASDFGDWQNYWGACGKDFKDFLQGLNIHYAAEKFGAHKWFDSDKTIENFEERIESFANNDLIDALRDEIENLRHVSSKDEFIHILSSCDNLMRFFNHCPELEYSIEPGFKRFWKEIWPVFTNELSKELVS